MKKMFSILIAISISIVFAAVSLAQTPGAKTPGVKDRQKHQQKRIRQGVRSGELTRKETVKLEKEQKEVQQDKKEAKSDGVVTKEERKELHKDQNKSSRHIYRAKHNKKDRN